MTSLLVVEDDEMFARALGRDLGEQGLSVKVVHSVVDALEVLGQHDIDVLLTDLQLGAEDGIDLLGQLRLVSPRTRAILMSGFATARDYQRAIELGTVRVLCKPFTPPELLQCIRQAVECETGFRGSVHGLSLVDMLQMFNYGRRSVTITVSGQNPGRLHLRDGQIGHVEHQGRIGEAALKSLLAMPAGTLSTSALQATFEPSITGDFRQILLDALRALDEGKADLPASDDLDLAFEDSVTTSEHRAVTVPDEPGPLALVLARMREIDGYIAVCLVLSKNGGVLTFDGSIDLRPVAMLTAEMMRQNQKTIIDMGLEDHAEDVLITSAERYPCCVVCNPRCRPSCT